MSTALMCRPYQLERLYLDVVMPHQLRVGDYVYLSYRQGFAIVGAVDVVTSIELPGAWLYVIVYLNGRRRFLELTDEVRIQMRHTVLRRRGRRSLKLINVEDS